MGEISTAKFPRCYEDGRAALGPVGLGLRRLRVAHDAEPVAEGLEGDYLVVPHPEPLPAAREVDVLGSEAQHPGVSVDRFLPLYGSAPEGAGLGLSIQRAVPSGYL